MKYSSWTRPLTLIAMSTTAALSHAAFNPQAALKMLNNPSAYSEAQLTEMANKIASENPQYGSKDWQSYWDSLEASLTAITPSPSAPVSCSVKGSSAGKLTCALLIWESKSLRQVPMNQLFSHRAALAVERNATRINLSKTLNLSNPSKKAVLKDTGLYVAPGETAVITVPRSLVKKGIKVIVGHTADGESGYKKNKEYPVMPYSSRSFSLKSETITVGNVHGGLIMLSVPARFSENNTDISFNHVLEAPHFILGETSNSEWIDNIRERGTPWGVMETDRAKMIWDSRWLKTLDNPKEVAQMWQNMVFNEEDFYGPIPKKPYRQHADYLGKTGLAVFPQHKHPDSRAYLDLDNLMIKGDGMMFHEYGHKLDLGAVWKWNGFSESANNWAGVYMTHTGFNFTFKDNVTPLRRARSYDYTLTKVDDFMASDTRAYLPEKMSMLTMMGDHFGWDTCRSIIHEIQAMPGDRYNSNQKRMDLWLTLLGKKIGYDVSPAMESWQWTFSNSAKGEVSHLPPFNALEQSKLNLIVESNKSVTFSSPVELGYSYDGTNLLDKISQPDNGSLTKNKDGTYTYTPDADYNGHDGIAYTLKNSLDNKFTDIIGITVVDTDDFPTLETGNAKVSNTQWTKVTLDQSFDSMVVIAQPILSRNQEPVVTRIRNASGNSFEVKLQRTDDKTGTISDVTIEYIVLKEGVYHPDTHGIRMEVKKYNSSITDNVNHWLGRQRDYAFKTGNDHYRQPLVFGQVMSANDPAWSTFWSGAYTKINHPAEVGKGFTAGKHVGEDPHKSRIDETIGYIVVEGGLTPQYQIGDVRFQVGSSKVDFSKYYHMVSDKSVSFTFDMMPKVSGAIIQASGVDKTDEGGYWTVLEGEDSFSDSTISARLVEDKFGSTKQKHGKSYSNYFAFSAQPKTDGNGNGTGTGGGSTPVNIGLFAQPLINPGFESETVEPKKSRSGIKDWYNSSSKTFTAWAASNAKKYPAAQGNNWAELTSGRWIYQQVGTLSKNTDYDVSLLLGARKGKAFLGATISLWAGGDPSRAKDNTSLDAIGAVQIATTGLIKPALRGPSSQEERRSVNTGTGSKEGLPLWLRIDTGNGKGRTLLDNVKIVKSAR